MKKILITGFSGFVARHFVEYLYRNNLCYEIVGVSRHNPKFDYSKFSDKLNISFYAVDLLDVDRLKSVFAETHPDYVLHLAAFSSVAYSWNHPAESFSNNSNIFLNLLDAIRDTNCSCRILSVGSSEEYGNVSREDLPIRENQSLDPLSPYAVARVAQEWMSKCYVDAYEMDIVLTRSFNHIGPGQDSRFVVPSFIKKIKDIKEAGKTEGVIETGRLEIIRDFVDVRDVVRAYYMLLVNGITGETYNICSGHGVHLFEIVDMLAKIIGVKVSTVVNPAFVRPNDNLEIVGSFYKMETELGWKPELKLEDTLADMVKNI